MKVLLFARLREALGEASLALPEGVQPKTVAELRQWLVARSDPLSEQLLEPNVVCAVNQQVVDDSHALAADDEIAFFPPVTGG